MGANPDRRAGAQRGDELELDDLGKSDAHVVELLDTEVPGCASDGAQEGLTKLLPKKPGDTIVYDAQSDLVSAQGRAPAYVETADEGQDVGTALIEQGFVRASHGAVGRHVRRADP